MITSTKNRQVVQAARLKKRALRDKESRFLVEGSQVALEALKAGRVEVLFRVEGEDGRLRSILERARAAGVRLESVSGSVMEHLTSTVTPQGVVGVASFSDLGLQAIPPDAHLVPVLCSVRDPGNAGTILRSADAAGADAVVFSSDSVDVFNPKTVRASAGSLFHLPVIRKVTAEEAVLALRSRGMQVLAAAADGEASVYDTDFERPTAILFGNEAWGLGPDLPRLADRTVRIPIRGEAESLNLAASAAVVLFEAARPRATDRGADLGRLAALAGMAAHDVRSPLTTLVGFLGTLAKNWERFPDEQRRDIITGTLLDVERVSSLIRLVVDAVRAEAGAEAKVQGERGDVGEAAAWVRGMFARSADFPEVRISGGGQVALEPERLRAVLLALCDGALWWGSDGPIEIAAQRDGKAIAVEVFRAGGGPDPEQAAVMLSEPERAGKVGLYAAASLVRWLGGDLSCRGGDGVRFLLRLPA